MALGTSNRDGGKTSESGHLRALMKGFNAEVLTGLAVSQRGAGANMSVDVAIGDAIIPRSDGTYGHPSFNDAVYNQAITTADPSNPRRDIIVMYIDYGETPSTGVSNNTNGVVKITAVAGTPAGSPSDPNDAAIQSAVGASNPFVKLARVRVAAGATSITNSVIDDLRRMASGILQGGWIYDSLYTWVYASASSFTIAGVDVTAQFPVGTKIALYQGGTIKYFVVTSTSFSTNTTVNVDGGGTYTLTNVPIDKPAFSYTYAPVGFPRQVVTDYLGGYQEIGRNRLTGSASVLGVSGLAPKRFLRIIALGIATGGVLDTNFTFNNDTGSNYANRHSVNFGASVDNTSSSSFAIESGQTDSGQMGALIMDIMNVAGQEKAVYFWSNSQDAAGAANLTTLLWSIGKWTNTSVPISSVQWNESGAGSFAAGSELIVLGKD